MEKIRSILSFSGTHKIFGREIEKASGRIVPQFVVASLQAFEEVYKRKESTFLKDFDPGNVKESSVDAVVAQIDKQQQISWNQLVETEPWLPWHVLHRYLNSLPTPLIPTSSAEKLTQSQNNLLKHQTLLLLHQHIVESLPKPNAALLEYISNEIHHFSDAFYLESKQLEPMFGVTCSAVFQKPLTQALWQTFDTLITYHDKIFRLKFHPMTNSLTLPPPISLAQMAQSNSISCNRPHDQELAPNNKRKIAVLALDGGGMRGLIEIKILSTLAKRFFGDCDENGTKKLLSKFDMIAGTSTGGIIAFALQKMSLTEVRKFYLSMGKQIFQSSYLYGIGRWLRYCKSGDYYNAETLTQLFKTEFGDQMLCHVAAAIPGQPKLFLAATNATNSVWEPFVLRSYENHTSIIPGASNIPTPDALRATSAAPTYFSAVTLSISESQKENPQQEQEIIKTRNEVVVQLVDGGMTANNPTELAIFEAHHLQDTVIDLIISIGTGMPGKQPGSVNVFKMLNELIDICTSSNAIHLRVLEWIEMMPEPKPNYFRFNPCNGEGSYSLDESNDAVLAALEASTELYLESPEVQEQISQLEKLLQER